MTENQAEIENEFILCSRYNELEDLRIWYQQHSSCLNVNCHDSFGNTALHMASANGHYLMSLDGIVIDVLNEEGNSPLHWAALNGHTLVVEALLEKNADPRIENTAGKSPVYEAENRKFEDIVVMMLKYLEKNDEKEVEQNDENVENEVEIDETSFKKLSDMVIEE